jgi:spermidine/putrescine transport system substrate-binding protein
MRRLLLVGALCAAAAVVWLLAQRGGVPPVLRDERQQNISWTCPPELRGGALALYNWSDYIGAYTISDFELLCGVTVTQDFYDTNESLLTRVRQGNPGFDVAFPNDYMVRMLVDEGLLLPITREHVPNLVKVDGRWLGMNYDPQNTYSVPYLWSSFGVGYRAAAFPQGIQSWYQVFEHAGPVYWIADQRAMFPVALALLGYDPNSVDPAEIRAARDFLLRNSSNVQALTEGGRDPLVTGEADAILTYNAEIYNLLLECACADYAYSVPQEGSIVDVTAAVILKGARNPRLAEAFIDYLHDSFVAASISNDIAYATTNEEAITKRLVRAELLGNPAVYLSAAAVQATFFLEPVTEAEQLYNDTWDELRIALGQ